MPYKLAVAQKLCSQVRATFSHSSETIKRYVIYHGVSKYESLAFWTGGTVCEVQSLNVLWWSSEVNAYKEVASAFADDCAMAVNVNQMYSAAVCGQSIVQVTASLAAIARAMADTSPPEAYFNDDTQGVAPATTSEVPSSDDED